MISGRTRTSAAGTADKPRLRKRLSSWTHPGSFAAFTTTSQAHSGSQSVFMGYFTPEALNSYVSQNVTSGSGTYDLSAYIKTETNLTGTGAILSWRRRTQTEAFWLPPPVKRFPTPMVDGALPLYHSTHPPAPKRSPSKLAASIARAASL